MKKITKYILLIAAVLFIGCSDSNDDTYPPKKPDTEEPELEPIGIYGQRHRRYLSLQRISEVPCSFVGVTFAFLFVESRVFSSFTPYGAAGAPRLPARYCGQRGLSGGWQG